jgi:hypothetical protein
MFEVQPDFKKNRLYFTLTHPTDDAIDEAIKAIEQTCCQLKPYFTCLNDLRNCASFLNRNEHLIEKTQKALWEMGVSKVVRVILPSTPGQFQLEMLGIVNLKYQADYTTSIQAAERILDRYQSEIDHSRGRTKKEMYKLIDMNGWEDETHFATYQEAVKRLKHIRKFDNTKNVIIVNSNVLTRRHP